MITIVRGAGLQKEGKGGRGGGFCVGSKQQHNPAKQSKAKQSKQSKAKQSKAKQSKQSKPIHRE
jgi:hypothetical protein